MTVDDIPAIMNIQEECGLSPWANNSYRIALKDPDFTLQVAKINQETVGFIAVRLITSENSCELLNIGVRVSMQKQKIGGKLIEELFGLVKSRSNRVLLEVREGNAGAIGFYKRYGFYPVGLRKNYYSDPVENALLMEKMLN
jgi:ribosomal-protein-alanine N-acetyltransferase